MLPSKVLPTVPTTDIVWSGLPQFAGVGVKGAEYVMVKTSPEIVPPHPSLYINVLETVNVCEIVIAVVNGGQVVVVAWAGNITDATTGRVHRLGSKRVALTAPPTMVRVFSILRRADKEALTSCLFIIESQ